jgi:hypothetical protein
MGQPEVKQRFTKFESDYSGIQDWHLDPVLQVGVRLVHRRRAENQGVRTVMVNGSPASSFQLLENEILFSRQQFLRIGSRIDVPDRRQRMLEPGLARQLFVDPIPALSHCNDGKSSSERRR